MQNFAQSWMDFSKNLIDATFRNAPGTLFESTHRILTQQLEAASRNLTSNSHSWQAAFPAIEFGANIERWSGLYKDGLEQWVEASRRSQELAADLQIRARQWTSELIAAQEEALAQALEQAHKVVMAGALNVVSDQSAEAPVPAKKAKAA